MEIHEILYQLRTKHKFSQENVANELGVDYTTYARYESGKVELKASQAKKLADLYNLSLDDFFSYGQPKPKATSRLEEPGLIYIKQPKLSLTIDLDGTQETVDRWLKIIPEMNRVLKMNLT